MKKNLKLNHILDRLKVLEIAFNDFNASQNVDPYTIYERILYLRDYNVSTPEKMNLFLVEFDLYFKEFNSKLDSELKFVLSKGEINLMKFVYIHSTNQGLSDQLGIGLESLRISIYRLKKKLSNPEFSYYRSLISLLN